MSGLICWFVALVVLAGVAAGVYYGLQFLGAQGLKREEEDRANAALLRKEKRIAQFGYDPMDPNDPRAPGADPTKITAAASAAANPQASQTQAGKAPAKSVKERPTHRGPSVVLLNTVARNFDRDLLIGFVQTAWDVEAAVNDPASGERIDVMDPSTAHLSIGGFEFDVLQLARVKTDVAATARAKTHDPAAQAVADGYLYALGVQFKGPPDLIDDAAAYGLVGKLAAQFVASDTLGLLLPQTQTLVPKKSHTAEILSGPDPVAGLQNA